MENKKQYCSSMDNERYDSDEFDSMEECAKERADDLQVGDGTYEEIPNGQACL